MIACILLAAVAAVPAPAAPGSVSGGQQVGATEATAASNLDSNPRRGWRKARRRARVRARLLAQRQRGGRVEVPLVLDADSLGLRFRPLSGRSGILNIKQSLASGNVLDAGTPVVPFWTVTITTPTIFVEKFVVSGPVQTPVTPAPMLVFFHQFGKREVDIYKNTNFLFEALGRGWYVLAPLGASKFNMGSIEAQINTETALDWMLTEPSFNIDTNRIYGVGFSMGGGGVTNFAARHLDPSKSMFAAVVDHTGGVSLNHTYFADITSNAILDFWYGTNCPGGSCVPADPWEMARSSLIDFDPMTFVVDPDTNLARNMLHMGVKITYATADPLAYLIAESNVLDAHLRALGVVEGVNYEFEVMPFTGHSWNMLDPVASLDFLEQYTLATPLGGKTLIDRNDRYFHFDVVQDTGGVFSELDWSVEIALNELHLLRTTNVTQIKTDMAATSLDTGSVLTVLLSTSDGLADTAVLTDYTVSPSQVKRDGTATGAWTYDLGLGELTLLETTGGMHSWEITP